MRALCLLKVTTMIFLMWGATSVSLATNVISQSNTAPALDFSLDNQANNLSGIYLSAITSEHPYYFRSSHRKLVLTITQDGNQIIATNEFWKIKSDDISIRGSRDSSEGWGGWNLTRLQAIDRG
jgi:hypothetical protein